jgi:hypothetical protein
MALSKVKSRKQQHRLKDRIDKYEAIQDKKGFKKPGSSRK